MVIKLNDIGLLAVEGKSARSSKHSVSTDGDSVVIASTKFKDSIGLPIKALKAEVKTVELSRQVMRGICKRQGVKYISSYQNVADKMFELLSAI